MRQLITTALTLSVFGAIASAAPTVEQLRERIQALEAENAALREKLAAKEARLEALSEKLNDVETDREKLAQAAEQQKKQAVEAERRRRAAEQSLQQAQRQRQAEAEQQRQRFVQREKDPESGRRVVQTRPIKLEVTHGSRAEHYVQIIAPAAGEQPWTMKLAGYGSGRSYHHLDSVTFKIDGSEIDLPIASYDRERRVTGSRKARVDRSHEFLELKISPSQVRQLAEANTVAGQVGPARFVGGRDLTTACRALLAAAEDSGGTGPSDVQER